MMLDRRQDDQDLLRLASQGRWEAFEMLMTRYEPRVLAVAKRILRQQQDAEDATQKTFLKVMENLENYRGEASVATWIHRIATNEALSLLRKRNASKTVLVGPAADDSDDPVARPEFIAPWRENPANLAQMAEVQQLIDEALDELDEKYRIVFILRDVEQMSTRETAEAIGISENNVKVRLLRARMQLRERLTRVLGDPTERLKPSDHNH